MAEEKKSSKINKNSSFFSLITATQLLYTLLLIAVFLIGYLVASVQYLTKGTTTSSVAAQGTTATAPTPSPAKVTVGLGHFPALGSNNAKVTIVEFADFRCPFCEQFFSNVEPQLMKDYVNTGKVKFVFRQFPFLGPASTVAANAAECANDQGKFWPYHDWLYKHQPSETDTSMYTTDKLTDVAKGLGMDGNKFKSCLSNNKDSKQVSSDLADGQKAGVSGTPTFYIDGIQLVGAQPYASFKTIIDQELSQKKTFLFF